MKRSIILVFLALFTAVFGFAQADLQPAAIVNLTKSEPITVKQFRTEVERMEKSANRLLSHAERLQILDVMINERLAMQAAERDRITISENEVNQQVQQIRSSMAQSVGRQPTDAEFAQAIREQSGLDMQGFRDQIKKQMIVQKYLMTKKETTFNALSVPTNEEITNAYNLARSQFVRPDTVRFSMIQAAYGSDAASKARAKELIDRLAREIGSDPSKFDDVSLRGQNPNSGYQAGDAGFLPRNMEAAQIVGQELINAAFSLKQGEVSRVIEGLRGYLIIKITATYAMKNLELDDIAQLGTSITVRDFIGNSMLQERQQALLSKASEELINELRTGNPFRIFEQNLRW